MDIQAEWLAPARAQLLRRVGIARRRRVLDLGAGWGAVTGELLRRSAGPVVALDRSRQALHAAARSFAGAERVCGVAERLPFAPHTFELVFCQCALLWMDASLALNEVWRILTRDGVLAALEPDYGGMIEHPPSLATRELWIAGLRRAGADPHIGRKLPGLLAACGFQTRVELLSELTPPAPERFDFLRELPLTADERMQLQTIEREAAAHRSKWTQVAHLPFMLVTARKTY